MLFYVEGPAGAGKTSFIKEAVARFPKTRFVEEYVVDSDPAVDKSFDHFKKNTEAKQTVLQELLKQPGDILVDRGHLSMLVNAFVEQEHGLNQSYTEARTWYEMQKKRGSLLLPDCYIYVSAPDELILGRAKNNDWYRDNLGWTRDPQLSKDTYLRLFNELEPEIKRLELDGSVGAVRMVDEFAIMREKLQPDN